jgi:hypothetical protein
LQAIPNWGFEVIIQKEVIVPVARGWMCCSNDEKMSRGGLAMNKNERFGPLLGRGFLHDSGGES